jgi:hypothetical protein
MANQNLPERSVVQIRHRGNKKAVYCEAIYIGENFLNHYNQQGRFHIEQNENSIAINEWYRAKLGILRTQIEEDLDIEITDSWRGRLSACLQHPQIIVRLATWLGLMSVFLGMLGIVPLICAGLRWIAKLF